MFIRPAKRLALAWLGALLFAPAATGAPPATGYQPETRVGAPTRLDWEFVAAGFGAEAAKLPADYDSRAQRYQLYAPPNYDRAKAWPLVVFISPGDDPLGWRYWRKPCEELGLLFCAAYGAGNNCPPGERVRRVLDVLDDVRRRYRIDPDQTYLTGFSGGGRLACTVAFALPEFFGGVAPVGGTNPLHPLSYLRHRVHDRLSVAFVTGSGDFNRRENEEYMAPQFQDLGIRARLWVVPNLGHAVPGPDVLAEIHDWLAEDLPRRRADAKRYPGLAADPDDMPTPLKQATRMVEAAEADLKDPRRVWQGIALLQGVAVRWGKTTAGEKARKLMEQAKADPDVLRRIEEQGGAEERQTLAAQGRAFERFGEPALALKAWRLLARQHADTAEGRDAAKQAQRLTELIAATPFLGVAFAGDTTTVAQVVPKGPADRGGMQPGDVLVQVAARKVANLADVKKAVQPHKPGQRIDVAVRRAGKTQTLTVELGSPPVEEDD